MSALRWQHLAVAGALEWRYLDNSTVKHALPSGGRYAICGAGPIWYRPGGIWRGTGNAAERERLEALPACRRCAKTVAQP